VGFDFHRSVQNSKQRNKKKLEDFFIDKRQSQTSSAVESLKSYWRSTGVFI
jgi:hypothetical protein